MHNPVLLNYRCTSKMGIFLTVKKGATIKITALPAH